MNYVSGSIAVAAAAFFFSGCATQQTLTEAEISNRYPELEQLASNLEKADEQDVDLLSSKLYQKSYDLYGDALISARNGSSDTIEIISMASETLTQAEENAESMRGTLSSVFVARDHAIQSGANERKAEAFAEAEEELMKLGNKMAKGDIAEVREERLKLTQHYANLEVSALKAATAQDARDQIKKARSIDADEYAPETYNKAVSELSLSEKVLEMDLNDRDKAAEHAHLSYQLASQSIQITEIIKEFEQSKMTQEQMVLWYQNQLSKVVSPVEPSPDFTQPNTVLVSSLTADIQSVVDQNQQNELALSQYKEQYASDMAANESVRLKQAELEARFLAVQSKFNAEEAEVYRQGDNVLIRSYGFSFPSGGSEIQATNYPLLKKITESIEQFPNAQVQVSGHTDNRGSEDLNQKLSTDRSATVAQFLVDVGNLDRDRISNVGFGKSRPLASNDTTEGRAANRRVEILIINDQ